MNFLNLQHGDWDSWGTATSNLVYRMSIVAARIPGLKLEQNDCHCDCDVLRVKCVNHPAFPTQFPFFTFPPPSSNTNCVLFIVCRRIIPHFRTTDFTSSTSSNGPVKIRGHEGLHGKILKSHVMACVQSVLQEVFDHSVHSVYFFTFYQEWTKLHFQILPISLFILMFVRSS